MEVVEQQAPPKQKRQKREVGGLREVANVPVKVKAYGREYPVGRFTLRDVAEAVQYLGPLSYVLQMLDTFPKDVTGKPIMSKGNLMELATRAAALSGDSIIGLVSVITKQPVEWVEAQDEHLDTLELIVTAVEKNMDFFSAPNIERAKALFARLGAVLPGRGTTPSGNSSSADTEPATTS